MLPFDLNIPPELQVHGEEEGSNGRGQGRPGLGHAGCGQGQLRLGLSGRVHRCGRFPASIGSSPGRGQGCEHSPALLGGGHAAVLSHQAVMREIIKHKGSIDYDLPHLKKKSFGRGKLPRKLPCDPEFVDAALEYVNSG